MGELLQGAFPGSVAAPPPPPQPLAAADPIASAPEGQGWDQQRRLWWLLWASCPGLGPVRLAQLEASPGGLEAAWARPLHAFTALPGWPARLLSALEQHRQRWGGDPLPRFASSSRAGRAVLLPGDPRWPAGLTRLPRPPLLLHWQGRGSLWPALARSRAVAVVGTRRPSGHGLSMARRLGVALAEAGWPVLSGLAEGIDGEAHRGCLAAGGAPVAVLGTPLNRVYPRHHAALQKSVGQRGLLISEHASGSGVRPGHFATRNRLLVAMAAAVVVVECPQASGALHSAEVAWQQGLPLWAVPADTGRQSAAGSNRLLSRGAAPLLTAEDLIAQLGAGPLRRPAAPAPAHPRQGACAGGGPGAESASEAKLLAALEDGAGFEQLLAALAIGSTDLSAALLQLELSGLVRAEPGLRWRRC
ncbi:MAG: DNA-processing protein DprA [Synechococcaceae cyanobacterium]|nr:DNA-processing protein DprA [Synechococcaceae cyanobacterium]